VLFGFFARLCIQWFLGTDHLQILPFMIKEKEQGTKKQNRPNPVSAIAGVFGIHAAVVGNREGHTRHAGEAAGTE